MARRMLGAKPLPEPTLTYCQMGRREQIGILSIFRIDHFQKRFLL